ncbi:MAG: hypothetical protein KatS3mg026_1253 [Bacteroidia bacterium]|nr:MAG: hypothetical protein KatS3mg026_1253 [Bacteroidia bacterium]
MPQKVGWMLLVLLLAGCKENAQRPKQPSTARFCVDTIALDTANRLPFARLMEENIKLAQQVNLLTQRMERVEAQIEALSQRVSDLTDRTERVEAQIEALTQRTERVEAQIEALTQRMERAEVQIEALTQRMDRVEAQIEALTQRMERAEVQIEALTQRTERVEAQIEALTQRMERAEVQIEALTQRLNDLTERMKRVGVHISSLTQRMDRVESQIEALAQQLKRNTDDLGELKGIILELRLPRKAVALYREEFRAVRVVPEEEWARLLDEGEEKGYLSGPEISDLSQVDGVIEAFRRSDNHPVVLAVEVSAVGDRQDVERAARRAQLLARLYSRLRGYPVIGIGSVTARQFTQGARKLASVRGVVLKTFPIKLR